MLGTASDISWAISSSSCCRRRLPSARQRWRIATELKKENKKLKLNFVFEMSETKWNEMKWNKWVTPHCACSNCKDTQWDDALLYVRSPSLVYNWTAPQAWWQSVTLLSHWRRSLIEYTCRESAPWRTSARSIAILHGARRSLVLVLFHSLACNWPAPLASCVIALSHEECALPTCCLCSLIEFASRESASARTIAILRSLCLSVRATSQSTPTGRSLVAHMRKGDGTMRTYA